MRKKIKNIDETLKELFIGILFYGIIVEMVGICFLERKVYFTIGLGAGVFLALGAAFHMWWSLNIGMDLGEHASKYILSQNMIRYGVIVAAFGVLCLSDIGSPLAAFAGVMSLKAGAYLQPFTHKIILKIKRR